MIRTGLDLEELLVGLGFRSTDYTWLVPRTSSQNQSFKITGILIAGFLSHRVIGQALATEKNVIFTSNSENRFQTNEILEILGETLYKNDMYILQWNKNWIFNTIQGELILAKILEVDYKNLSKSSNNYYRIELPAKMYLHNYLQRFKNLLLYINENASPTDISFKNLSIIVDENKIFHLPTDTDVILTLVELPESFIRTLLSNNRFVITLGYTELLNEISREFYYLIKQGEELDIDLSFNSCFRKLIIQK